MARSQGGIHVCQRKYALDILADSSFLGVRPVKLLLCLTLLSIEIGWVLMDSPTISHLHAVHKILLYVKRAPGQGLTFPASSSLSLRAFCDFRLGLLPRLTQISNWVLCLPWSISCFLAFQEIIRCFSFFCGGQVPRYGEYLLWDHMVEVSSCWSLGLPFSTYCSILRQPSYNPYRFQSRLPRTHQAHWTRLPSHPWPYSNWLHSAFSCFYSFPGCWCFHQGSVFLFFFSHLFKLGNR